MDKLYDDILISQDIERAMERNLSKIERRITDIDKLLNESMLSKVRKSMKVSLNISDLLFRTMVGASLGNEFKFPTTIGGMLGAISSFIKIDIDVVRQPKTLPPEVQDYAYLYYSKNEI